MKVRTRTIESSIHRSKSRLWSVLLAALVAMLMLPSVDAQARGKRRAVPDLGRDADRWSAIAQQRIVRLPVTLHMATEAGSQLVSARRVSNWVLRANAALRPYGIEVYVEAVRFMPEGFSAVTRWQQRRQLASYAPNDGTIHAFVIEDLDDPERHRGRRVRGLHWRYRGVIRKLRAREYVVITGGAPMTTFAHELGHLFGLRHSSSGNNIMCSCREGPVAFTATQGEQMRAGASRYIARQGGTYGRARLTADRRRR